MYIVTKASGYLNYEVLQSLDNKYERESLTVTSPVERAVPFIDT